MIESPDVIIDRSFVSIFSGHNRVVLCIGSVVIKIPRWVRGYGIAYGLLSNCLEADRWRHNRHFQMAQVYWCAVGGLALIAWRYRIYTQKPREFLSQMPFKNVDVKTGNIALFDGYPVLLDYGNDDWDCGWSPGGTEWTIEQARGQIGEGESQ